MGLFFEHLQKPSGKKHDAFFGPLVPDNSTKICGITFDDPLRFREDPLHEDPENLSRRPREAFTKEGLIRQIITRPPKQSPTAALYGFDLSKTNIDRWTAPQAAPRS